MGPALAYALRYSPVSPRDVMLAIRIPMAFSLALLIVLMGLDRVMGEMHYLLRLGLLCGLALFLFVTTSLVTPRLRHDFLFFLGTLGRKSQQPGE
jgi:membrane-associated phospholipid phosphatase